MFGDRINGSVSYGPINSDGNIAARAIGVVRGIVHITEVLLLNSASGASHATNYVVHNLINMGTDGTGTTVIASASTVATHFPANKAFRLAITDANKVMTDGQVIGFERAEQNTDAPAQAACHVQVRFQQVGPQP